MSSKRRRAAKRRSPRPASQQQQQQTRTASAAVPVAEAPPRRAPRPRDEHRKTAAAPAPVSGEASLGRVPVLAAAATGLIAFIVYLVTIEPSVPTGDSGELITAAKVLGVAHPPGYPLYTMLGHFATMISFGHAALGMNILSALLDAATVGIVFVTIYRLVGVASEGRGTDRRVWMPLVAPAVGALLLAFSTEFWTYSVVAEVFALNNLFAALLLLLALAARIEASRYEPVLVEVDTLTLARAAVPDAQGEGATVVTDPPTVERSLVALADCAKKHGGVPAITLRVDGSELTLAPVNEQAAPVILGDDLRDLGAAVAMRAIRALGGSVELSGEDLRISLNGGTEH